MTANNNTKSNALPKVGITATPTAPVIEGSGIPEVLTIGLSEPAPQSGLKLNFVCFDSDGVDGDETLTTKNISDIQSVPNVTGTGSIITSVIVAEGASEAQVILTPIDDGIFEGLETNYFFLQPGDGYTVDPNNSSATTTLIDSLTSLPIKNAGFEEPELADGIFTYGSVPGWDIYDPNDLVPDKPTDVTSNVDVFNPDAIYYPDEAPQGKNVGDVFLVQAPGSGVAGLSQTLDTLLTANTEYTLQVDVGNATGSYEEIDLTSFPGYRVELLAGDTVLASEQNNLFIEEGTFGTSTVTFTATADSPYLGQNLGIRLLNILQGPGVEISFDNVGLTAQAIPDIPATVI